MIRTLLFDLDDTILDFHHSEREALSVTLKSFGIKPEEKHLIRYSEINDRHWKLLELGKISRQEVLLHRFVEFTEEFAVNVPAEDIKRTYEDNLSRGYFIIPGACDMLKRLSPEFDLYLVSNGTPRVQYGRLKGTGIGKYFKAVFISEELGYEKPDRRFFEKAFSLIPGLKKEETAIVGDSLTSDIKGGINAGIITIWYNPSGRKEDRSIRPDFTISGWDGLFKLLGLTDTQR